MYIATFIDPPNFVFIRGDVNNYYTLYMVFYSFHPELVYHYAACVGVQRTLDNPLWVMDDIKGLEYDVLVGAQNTIKMFKPAINLGIHPRPLKENVVSIHALLELIKELKYTTYLNNKPLSDKDFLNITTLTDLELISV